MWSQIVQVRRTRQNHALPKLIFQNLQGIGHSVLPIIRKAPQCWSSYPNHVSPKTESLEDVGASPDAAVKMLLTLKLANFRCSQFFDMPFGLAIWRCLQLELPHGQPLQFLAKRPVSVVLDRVGGHHGSTRRWRRHHTESRAWHPRQSRYPLAI